MQTALHTRSFIKQVILATGLSVAVNLVLAAIGRAASAPPETFGPYMYSRVAGFTALGIVGASVAYALMRRYLDAAKTDRYFIILSLVILVISFYPDVALPWSTDADDIGWTYGIMANLMLMHVVAAGFVVKFFTHSDAQIAYAHLP